MPTNNREMPSVEEWERAGCTSGKAVWDLALRQVAYLRSNPQPQKVTGELREAINSLLSLLETVGWSNGLSIQHQMSAVRSALAKCETTRELTDAQIKAVRGIVKILGRDIVDWGDEILALKSAFASVLHPTEAVKDESLIMKMESEKCLKLCGDQYMNPTLIESIGEIVRNQERLADAIDELRKKP